MNLTSQTDQTIQIKGIKEGLLITFGNGDWETNAISLLAQLDDKAGFFQGAKVILDTGYTVVHAADLGSMRDKLSDRGLVLTTVISYSSTTETTAQMLGLATRLSKNINEKKKQETAVGLEGEHGLVIQRTLRSGFHVDYDGHVIVLGDVNPGAEIHAGGSIVIWGKLKGVASAGTRGDRQAVICALEMEPSLLKICDIISASFPNKKKIAQVAFLKDQVIQFNHWDTKTK